MPALPPADSTAAPLARGLRMVPTAVMAVAAAGLLLVFALWWSYFKHSAAEEIRQSLRWTFVWAFGHYLIFAAVAALGAGLQISIETLTHSIRVSPQYAALAVAIPVATYLVVYGLLTTRTAKSASARLTLLTAALVPAVAAATPAITLPVSMVIMVVLVAALLAYHLATEQALAPVESAEGDLA